MDVYEVCGVLPREEWDGHEEGLQGLIMDGMPTAVEALIEGIMDVRSADAFMIRVALVPMEDKPAEDVPDDYDTE
jgi:hypothetical protein